MRLFRVLALSLFCCLAGLLHAQEAAPPDSAAAASSESAPASASGAAPAPDMTTQAAAAVASGAVDTETPDIIDHSVDLTLGLFGVKEHGNTWQHWGIAALITLIFYVLRKVVAKGIFRLFGKATERTSSTLDDKLVRAWHPPVGGLIAVIGAILAIKVLDFSPEAEVAYRYLRTVALAVVILWFFINTVATILDHLQDTARARGSAVAAFMPWIKKSIITIVLIFGVLVAAQSLGADVKAFLAGLGIGGLAFALAAQDTLANVFGSVVVAVDQPFRIGDFVQIGAHQGTVEDIGLRSTRLRTPDRTLISIPNRTVANEAVNNFSRMPHRRVVQTIGVTYDASREQLEGLVNDIRALLANDPRVLKQSALVHFLNFGGSSLDIQIIYVAADPDGVKTMNLRQEINLELMRLVEARGLSFAFPTQTIELGESAARVLAARPVSSEAPPPPAAPNA
jgi:Small-conductance mechanosensitive channel